MAEKEDMSTEEKDTSSRVYELGYLLVPTITEEDLPVIYGNLKDLVSSSAESVITDEMPKMIPLAYTMSKITTSARNKFTTGYFGWIKFSMDSTKIIELKKHLDADPNFIRFIITKTVKEDTMVAKRFPRGETYRRTPSRKSPASEPAVPINKEEVDKEIDALVAS